MFKFWQPLIFLAVLLIFRSVGAEVYRWTDEKGKVHFSDKPHMDSTKLDIQTPKPSGIGTTEAQRESQKKVLKQLQKSRQLRTKEKDQNSKQKAKIEKYCSRLQNRLKNYDEVDYVFIRDASGKKKRLTSQQKKDEETKIRNLIAERC